MAKFNAANLLLGFLYREEQFEAEESERKKFETGLTGQAMFSGTPGFYSGSKTKQEEPIEFVEAEIIEEDDGESDD